jgi:hypothetical protein
MVAAMLSEDLPPLAPFPEVSSPPDPGAEKTGEPSLLSAAQRRELAMAADSLTGRSLPVTDDGPASAADDFLLGPASGEKPGDLFDIHVPAPVEEAPVRTDFLDLPSADGVSAAGLTDGFNLQSLAASLAVPALIPPGPAVVTSAPVSAPSPGPVSRRRDNWEPPVVPAFPSLTVPEAKPLTSTGAAAPVPLPTGTDHKDGFFVTLPPVEATPAPKFPAPRLEEPVDQDFDAPLLFPVPSAESHAPAHAAEVDPHDRAIAPILCGALLIVLGLILACLVPSLALEADAAAGSGKIVSAGHLRGGIFLCIAGAAACLVLGTGAVTLRRWAPPLIHAAGWTVLLAVLCEMAVATASMFYLSANDTPGDAVPGDGTAIFVVAGLLGVALPLLLIALFQRPGVAKLCTLADPRPRWTDSRSVPALMVFVSATLLAVAAFTLSLANAAFRRLIEGNGAWAGAGLAALAAAGLAASGRRAGWWLLAGLALALTAAVFLTFRTHAWRELFNLSATVPPDGTGAALAAATLSPLVVIVLMTRRAFERQGHS